MVPTCLPKLSQIISLYKVKYVNQNIFLLRLSLVEFFSGSITTIWVKQTSRILCEMCDKFVVQASLKKVAILGDSAIQNNNAILKYIPRLLDWSNAIDEPSCTINFLICGIHNLKKQDTLGIKSFQLREGRFNSYIVLIEKFLPIPEKPQQWTHKTLEMRFTFFGKIQSRGYSQRD